MPPQLITCSQAEQDYSAYNNIVHRRNGWPDFRDAGTVLPPPRTGRLTRQHALLDKYPGFHLVEEVWVCPHLAHFDWALIPQTPPWPTPGPGRSGRPAMWLDLGGEHASDATTFGSAATYREP